ncbi:zf-HC2 domain-containing protein [bacterium]|nr:zf-HC2 domain-containing protein [bacterium]
MGNDFRIIFDADDGERIPTPETLSEYARGQLDAERARQVKRHLEKDWRARQLAEQLEETWFLLDAWSDRPAPADAAARFSESLAKLVERDRFLSSPLVSAPRRRFGLGSFFMPLSWAAALVLVCLSTYYAFLSLSEPGAVRRSVPAATARAARPTPTLQVAQAGHSAPTPVTVKAPVPRPVLPPGLERNYPHTAARLAALPRDASGLLGANSPRLPSLLVAEEAGVMFEPINAVLDMDSHDIRQAMATMAAQMDPFVARVAPDSVRPADGAEPRSVSQ